jgi:hypothetical protein
VILYRSKIGNLGEKRSTITKIVLGDENPLKLDDHGFVRYHGSQIRKLKIILNGRLEDNSTAEFHLRPGEVENYYTRNSSEDCRLSGIQQRIVMG